MTQNKEYNIGRIVETKFAFRENGVIVKTELEENGWSRDAYDFPDGSLHRGSWYKDECDTSGELLKRSFLLKNGERRDAYFKDGELKKIIKYFGDGEKKAIYFNKIKDRVTTFFDEDGLMEARVVSGVDGHLILRKEYHGDGIMNRCIFFNSKGLIDYTDEFNENGEKLYTEFPPNEKGEIKRRIYRNGKSYIEVYNSYHIFLYEEHLMNDNEYRSMRVYRDGDVVKRKEFLDKNGVVREQIFYCNGIVNRTKFLDAEGVVVRTVGYDALGRIETVKQLDDESLEYKDAATVQLTEISKNSSSEENLLPQKEKDLGNK